MHKHRWLTGSLGLALLLTTAASTTYAQGSTPQSVSYQTEPFFCNWLPLWPWCSPRPNPIPNPDHGPSLSATPELDSLLLFGFGLSGIGGYAVTRLRARRRG